MMLFANLDTLENRVLGVYPCENELVAKRANLSTLYQVNNPIGLTDRVLIKIGEIDMATGIITPLSTPVVVCNMAQLYEELKKLREVVNNGYDKSKKD